MAEARLQPGTPPSAAWCCLGTHQSPVAQPSQPQLSPCALKSQTHPSSCLGGGGQKKIKINVPHRRSAPHKALQMTHQGSTLLHQWHFSPHLIPIPLFFVGVGCCFKTIFLRLVRISERLFDKDGPGSWMINIIFLTCLALSATCKCSLPRVGSSSLTFLQLPRSFPCFLSPWVCAAFSANS